MTVLVLRNNWPGWAQVVSKLLVGESPRACGLLRRQQGLDWRLSVEFRIYLSVWIEHRFYLIN